MEVNEAIINRRSIRKFINKEVDDQNINKIINAARLAPSAKNRQPWLFKITTEEEKNKIADMMIIEDHRKKMLSSSISFTANSIKQAKELILVLYNDDPNWIEFDLLSIGAAVENMCLEAESLNLSTLWIGDINFISEKICNELNINNHRIISALAVGYKKEEAKKRPRKSIDEILI